MKYIVTSVCYFTKWVEVRPIPDKTGLEVAHFIYWLFMRYGCMEVCISDQGEFNSLKCSCNTVCLSVCLSVCTKRQSINQVNVTLTFSG